MPNLRQNYSTENIGLELRYQRFSGDFLLGFRGKQHRTIVYQYIQALIAQHGLYLQDKNYNSFCMEIL